MLISQNLYRDEKTIICSFVVAKIDTYFYICKSFLKIFQKFLKEVRKKTFRTMVLRFISLFCLVGTANAMVVKHDIALFIECAYGAFKCFFTYAKAFGDFLSR